MSSSGPEISKADRPLELKSKKRTVKGWLPHFIAPTLLFSLDESDLTHVKHSVIMSQASSLPSRREFLTICGGAGIISSFLLERSMRWLPLARASRSLRTSSIERRSWLVSRSCRNKRKRCYRSCVTRETASPRFDRFILPTMCRQPSGSIHYSD
jgi:hypothetical protein